MHNYGIFQGRVQYDLFDGGTKRANVPIDTICAKALAKKILIMVRYKLKNLEE